MKDPAIDGLIMWDCVAFLDDETIDKIDELSDGKGIANMVVSHPHYYSTTALWAAAFPKMNLWLAEVDFHDWYQRFDIISAKKDAASADSGVSSSVAKQIQLVNEEQTLLSDSTSTKILLLGGHFPGSLVLLWEDCLFIADTIQVVPSGLYKSVAPQRKGVTTFSFMWRSVGDSWEGVMFR
jgi:glyoxylase-like metal-dependent hydrolase (beta-lactamase superfamily II)